MRNILAIANKELRSYFASPIAYIVIGVFALLYGYFYVAILAFFVRQSMQMSQFGAGAGQSMRVGSSRSTAITSPAPSRRTRGGHRASAAARRTRSRSAAPSA